MKTIETVNGTAKQMRFWLAANLLRLELAKSMVEIVTTTEKVSAFPFPAKRIINAIPSGRKVQINILSN